MQNWQDRLFLRTAERGFNDSLIQNYELMKSKSLRKWSNLRMKLEHR